MICSTEGQEGESNRDQGGFHFHMDSFVYSKVEEDRQCQGCFWRILFMEEGSLSDKLEMGEKGYLMSHSLLYSFTMSTKLLGSKLASQHSTLVSKKRVFYISTT